MRCTKCDYLLWNLKPRQCPECGTPFVTSDYNFPVNDVVFCCPHCSHEHHPNTRTGLIDPLEFDCHGCGQRVHLDNMIVRPHTPDVVARLKYNPSPWLKRPQKSWINAFLHTTYLSMFHPCRLMDRTHPQDGNLAAFSFAITVFAVAGLLGIFFPIMLVVMMNFLTLENLMGPVMLFVCVYPTLTLGSLLFLIGAIHLMLKITGKPAHSIDGTFKALSYSTGPFLLLAFPCVNYFIFFISVPWVIICSALALARMQRMHPAHTAIIVVIPAGVFVILFLLIMILGQ